MEDIAQLPPAQIESRLPDSPPWSYYGYASRLWSEGENDKALLWLYVGQLRFRFLMAAAPDADPSGGPAMFESLQAAIGQPIFLYAGSDTKNWAHQIDAALEWDATHDNGVTSKTRYRKQWEEVRESCAQARDYIVAHADEIAQQRAQEGIGVVGVKDGVYVEEHRRKMPRDCPALTANTSLDGIAGVYKASLELANALFAGERKVLVASTFSISREGNNMLVVARKGDAELLRHTLEVREQDGAVLFEETDKPDNMSEGSIHVTSYMRLNAAGDLVIERDQVAAGKYQNRPIPFRTVYTFWVRAPRVSTS